MAATAGRFSGKGVVWGAPHGVRFPAQCIPFPGEPLRGAEVEARTFPSKSAAVEMVGFQPDIETPARPECSPAIDDPDAGTWHVAHTRINMERRVAQALFARDVDFYLPLVDRVVIQGGKRRVVPTPAFSRYVFIRGGPDAPAAALATQKLLALLPIANQKQFRTELAAVERAIALNPRAEAAPYAVKGRRCRITAGGLSGAEGVVLDRKERTDRIMVYLAITTLGQGVQIEVDASLLEPVD